jgi:hypothetical protein
MLTGHIEDNVLCALCWSDNLAGEIVLKIKASDFSTQIYRRIAEEAIKFYEQYGQPPRTHLRDRLEAGLHHGADGRFMADLLLEMENRLASELNEDFVRAELDEFLLKQRLINAIGVASDLLHNGDLAQAVAVLGPPVTTAAARNEPPVIERFWPTLNDAALHGLAGEFVRMIAPQSETAPAALLFQFLTAFGNLVGRNPYWEVEATRHRANIYTILVGRTAIARKGTAWGRVQSVFKYAEAEDWLNKCLWTGSLGSGEGIINRIRDLGEGETQNDKRLLVMTPEFGTQLRINERAGSTVVGILRDAWDSPSILRSPLIKSAHDRATGAHISVIGHITLEELRRYLTVTDIADGFANRFLFICVERVQLLPKGGRINQNKIDQFARRVDQTARIVNKFDEVEFDPETDEFWAECYHGLSTARDGLFGAVMARADAQVRRLALLYSLLDRSDVTRLDHLVAAMSAWEYTEASAEYIFGGVMGDVVAEAILRALQQADDRRMTRWQIYNILSGNQSSERIGQALTLLKKQGRARREHTVTGQRGRPTETWHFIK